MPGYILHLTAAKMMLDKMKGVRLDAEMADLAEVPADMHAGVLKAKNILKDKKAENAFLAGSLLPDSVRDKRYSHFRNEKRCEEMIEYPDLRLFLDKYRGLICESSCLGYYFHLYIDNRFFKNYLPSIIEFEDEKGCAVTRREDVKWVYMRRSGQRIRKEEFFSENYYYGDYTRMNTYLVERYRLPLKIGMNISNPGIEEVDYRDLEKILDELQGYLCVSADEADNVRVFCVEELLRFLEETVDVFLKWLGSF